MHPLHQEILTMFENYAADQAILLEKDGDRSAGAAQPEYFLRAAGKRRIFSTFKKAHPDLALDEFVALLDSLSQAETHIEFVSVGLLLKEYPRLRRVLDPYCLERWLERAESWSEVDVICQLNFTAAEVLADWATWSALLSRFSRSANIHLRRASLVLLTKPLRQSGDPRLAQHAFALVDQLKGEKAILITKAVSWILRTLIKHHRPALESYLAANADSLPKVALRETRHKLEWGVKQKRTTAAGDRPGASGE